MNPKVYKKANMKKERKYDGSGLEQCLVCGSLGVFLATLGLLNTTNLMTKKGKGKWEPWECIWDKNKIGTVEAVLMLQEEKLLKCERVTLISVLFAN